MRISDRLAANLVRLRSEQARAALARAQARVSSGLRVARPADDPAAYAQALGSSDAVARTREHLANAARGMDMLDAATSALTSAHGALTRARELALSGGSGVGAPQPAAAAEVEQLREALAALRRTECQGEAVFRPAARERRIEVGQGVTVAASVDGDRAFAGAVDLDVTLAALAADLRAGDGAAIRGRLDALAAGLRQLEDGMGEAGAARAAAEIARQAAERADLAFQGVLDRAVKADPVEALTALTANEGVLRAALEVGTRLLRPVLADRI